MIPGSGVRGAHADSGEGVCLLRAVFQEEPGGQCGSSSAVKGEQNRTGGRRGGGGQVAQGLGAILRTEFYSEWDGQLLESSEQRNDTNHLTFYEDPSGHWVELRVRRTCGEWFRDTLGEAGRARGSWTVVGPQRW